MYYCFTKIICYFIPTIKLKETYYIIKHYLLNGAYAYSLFGLYAITVAPFVSRFIDYGETSIIVGIFGFIMLIAEFFALNFKLKMVRMRVKIKSIAYQRETGIHIMPRISPFMHFQFFMRLLFRVTIVMVSMTALGYPCTEKKMSEAGIIVLMTAFLLDFCGMAYIFIKSGMFNDRPNNKKELIQEIKDDEKWSNENLPLMTSKKYFNREIFSDIILQIYALMLYTSIWKHLNEFGIGKINESLGAEDTAFSAGFGLFLMLLIMATIGLIPIRIAYWIEDAADSFTKREKFGTWFMFFIVAIFTCAPTIINYIRIFIIHDRSEAAYLPSEGAGLLISLVLFVVILLAQIALFGKKEKK